MFFVILHQTPTISITSFLRLCLCLFVRFWKMSQFSSWSSLKPTARWWFSKTDSSLYIRASSESEGAINVVNVVSNQCQFNTKRQPLCQNDIKYNYLPRNPDDQAVINVSKKGSKKLNNNKALLSGEALLVYCLCLFSKDNFTYKINFEWLTFIIILMLFTL